MTKKPAAPSGLGPSGRLLWRSLADVYEFDGSEQQILHEACRTADELDRLAVALVDVPLEVVGSTGQPRSHPLLDEIRRHRSTLSALIMALRLPAEGQESGESVTTVLARRAVQARWDRVRADGA